MLAERARFMTVSLRSARAAIAAGRDPTPYLDNVNALTCGMGTHFYVDAIGRLCCNTIHNNRYPHLEDMPIPAGVKFELDKITVFHPDGRVEVMKDRSAIER